MTTSRVGAGFIKSFTREEYCCEQAVNNGFKSFTGVVCKNSCLQSTIAAYIPSEKDMQLIETCQATFSEKMSSGELLFSELDLIESIFSKIDLKSLVTCSTVSRCFYLGTKKDSLWHIQLSNLLSEVKVVPSNLCSFSPEQQFKIIYKRISGERELLIDQFEKNQIESLALLKQVDEAKREFESAGGNQAFTALSQKIRTHLQTRKFGKQSPVESCRSLVHHRKTYLRTKGKIECLNGQNYDGTPESISEDCEQGKILQIIKIWMPAKFNKQEEFNKVMLQSKFLENTNSSNRSVILEDLINSPSDL